MMTFLYIVLAIVALILIVALIAPKSYEVHRRVIINKPLPEVFEYIKHVKHQNDWSPWKLKDPNMKQDYFGIDGTVGFISKWEGNKEVGSGEQEIKSIVDNENMVTELRFLKPWKSVSDGFFNTNKIAENQTEVVWGFKGKNPIPFNVFMLFFSFEKAVGKDFEEGLSKLKSILENK